MRRIFILLVALSFIPVAMANDAANIKIRMNGALKDNRYFLCLPNVGCLSVRAAARGKVYPVFQPIEMRSIYMMDAQDNFKVAAQNLPPSCNVTVEQNQTVTISGNIVRGANNRIVVNQLHCTVR